MELREASHMSQEVKPINSDLHRSQVKRSETLYRLRPLTSSFGKVFRLLDLETVVYLAFNKMLSSLVSFYLAV